MVWRRSWPFPLLLLLSSLVHSQVIIRERLQIAAERQPAPGLVSTESTTLRVESSFGGPLDPMRPHLFYITGACDNSAGTSMTGGSIEVVARAGSYFVGYRFSVPRTGGSGQFRFAVFLGEDMIKQVKTLVNCPSGCTLLTHDPLLLYDGFSLIGGGEIWYGETNRLTAAAVSLPVPCGVGVWHPAVPITVEITRGSQYGRFVGDGGEDLGHEVRRLASEFGSFAFVADGEPPPDEGGIVEIRGRSSNVVVERSFRVRRRVPHHFDVRVERDTVAFTESSKIFVQAKDENDLDVAFDEGEKMVFRLTENPRYGGFIDVDGDTVRGEPAELGDVRYGDAQSGGVRFAAVAKNPDSVVSCRVGVHLRADAGKRGDTTVVVVEQTLKIVMEEPREVLPRLPRGGVLHLLAENRKEFGVRLTRGGVSVGGHPFRLTSNYVEGTGGHDHVNRRPENDENYGYFISRQAGGEEGRPLAGETQAGVLSRYDFVASVFGDRMLLRVQSTRNELLWDTVSIVERVPDLELLPDGSGYVKVGGTCDHHGPRDDGAHPNCRTPDNNHWGTANVIESLIQIAATWHVLRPREAVLAINDISLPHGGLFDAGGKWSAPHSTHRNGRDADVRTEFPGVRQGIPIRAPRASTSAGDVVGNLDFEELCLVFGARRASIHGTRGTTEEHYHVYF